MEFISRAGLILKIEGFAKVQWSEVSIISNSFSVGQLDL